MKDVIIAALAKLDPAVDSHWTADGLVNLNSFKFIAGGVAVTREQLEEVAPNFTRSTPQVDVSNEELKVSATQEGETAQPSQAEITDLADEFSAFQASPNALAFSGAEFQPVATMDDESLNALCETYLDQIDELNNARAAFNKRVDESIVYLHSVKAEQDRRQPKMTLAEMVRKSHELNASTLAPANVSRSRPHPVYPVLNRK